LALGDAESDAEADGAASDFVVDDDDVDDEVAADEEVDADDGVVLEVDDGEDGEPVVVGGLLLGDPDGLGEVEVGDPDGLGGPEVRDGDELGRLDGEVGPVVGRVVGPGGVVGRVVGVVGRVIEVGGFPPLPPEDGGTVRSGPWVAPSTEPYTRVASNSRVQRTGVSRTLRPVRGASTIMPSPAYIATWWIPVQLFVELKNSRSPGSSEYRSTTLLCVCQYWSRATRASG
jgi:hypothetical protein